MRMFFSYLRARTVLTGKGYLRAFSFAMVLLFLFLCAFGAVSSARKKESAEGAVKIKVGIVGSLDDTYIDIGLFALKHFDSSKYYVDVLTLEEEEAQQMLSDGRLAGYVRVPEGFAKAALGGDEVSLDYVCADSPATLVPQLMNEVVAVISDYVTGSQNGIYAFMDLCRDQGIPHSEYSSSVDILAAKYLKTILARDGVWTVNEGLPSGQLGFSQYYGCALVLAVIMLAGIALSPVMIREDMSYCRLLRFRGMNAASQVAAEYAPLFLLLWAVCTAAVIAAVLYGAEGIGADCVLGIIPALLTVSAMQFFLYEISGSVIGGVFLQLLCTVSMALASGFIFPFGGLPETVRTFAAVLPARVAFESLSSCITGETAGFLWAAETVLLLCASVAVRELRIRGKKR